MKGLRNRWKPAAAVTARVSRRVWSALRGYVSSRVFWEDVQCYGGIALLAAGVSFIYSTGHAMAVAGSILMILPMAARLLEVWSYRMYKKGD